MANVYVHNPRPRCASSKFLSGLAVTTALLTLIGSPSAVAVSCDFKNGDVFTQICGYIEAGGVQTGGHMKVHVSSSTPSFDVHIRRAGNTNPNLQTTSFSGAGNHNPGTTTYNGLNWGASYSVNIPSNWSSGIYEVSFNNSHGGYPEFVAIRAANPGSHSKVLVLDSLPTKIAYSPIGGKSLYGFNSTNGQATTEVSMERPTGRGQWTQHREFAEWLDQQGIPYEAASMMDIHRDPNLLKNYNLVILLGHNEYWSKEMRDAWDNYLADGGNGAIFGGNTMWWQVRFSPDNKHMICYKNAYSDPLYNIDNSRVTTNWFREPVDRPENLSTGVSFRNGGYHNYTEAGVQYYVKNGYGDDGSNGGFKVADASHWVFAGTGLNNGNVFGRGDGITSMPVVGYEVDGALFTLKDGKPVVSGEDGTPRNFQVLALAPTYAVDSADSPGLVTDNYNGHGWGTLGIFKPSNNSGTVFVAPTISWADGLHDRQVGQITKNVINQLKNRTQQNTGNTTTTGNGASNGSANTNTGTNAGSTTTPVSGSSSTSANNNAATEVVLQTRSSGGGGSFPLATILLGILTIVGLQLRKS